MAVVGVVHQRLLQLGADAERECHAGGRRRRVGHLHIEVERGELQTRAEDRRHPPGDRRDTRRQRAERLDRGAERLFLLQGRRAIVLLR